MEGSIMPKPLPEDSWQNLFYPPSDYKYFENAGHFRFEPGAAAFSWKNAWWLADMSLLAYVKEWGRDVKPALQLAGFDQVEQIGLQQNMSTKGFMASRSGPDPFAVVAFRGTDRDDSRTTLTDLDTRTKPSQSGDYVLHKGFSDAFEQVWQPEIDPWLNNFRAKHSGGPVYFTGHSLGAALATIGMARFTSGNSASYTFGCPRVGDDRFTQLVLSRGPVFRFVNSQDIVTQIPLEILGTSYFRHVGVEKYIDRHGSIHDSVSSAYKWSDILPGIAAHARQLGLAALDELMHPDKLRADMLSRFPKHIGDAPPGAPPFLVGNHSPARYPIHIWNYYSVR